MQAYPIWSVLLTHHGAERRATPLRAPVHGATLGVRIFHLRSFGNPNSLYVLP